LPAQREASPGSTQLRLTGKHVDAEQRVVVVRGRDLHAYFTSSAAVGSAAVGLAEASPQVGIRAEGHRMASRSFSKTNASGAVPVVVLFFLFFFYFVVCFFFLLGGVFFGFFAKCS
jgi:hypothetical protein